MAHEVLVATVQYSNIPDDVALLKMRMVLGDPAIATATLPFLFPLLLRFLL